MMRESRQSTRVIRWAMLPLVVLSLQAQRPPDSDGPPPFGPGGPGPMQQPVKVLRKFDKDGDGHLNLSERKAAREFLNSERSEGRMRRRGPRFGGGGRNEEPPGAGPKLSPSDVKSYPGATLYDPQVLRTFFIEFEDANWERELADFNRTDVDVPAKVMVDGKTYSDVGVHFRGMSSYFMVPEGRKRSLNLSFDYAHKEQKLGGYRTLNLLNSHEDPSFLRSVLYSEIARQYLPAPKANFVRVVIDGESWGIYVNAEQFNKDSVKEWFGTTKGARWKVPGSPGGRGSLAYIGDDPEEYKPIYAIKTKDDPKAWKDLINLCKVLHQTPADKLEQTLSPLLDIEGALKFLALENALINNDGYWIRTSDYNIYEDEKGRFHIIPHDTNETFSNPEGPGGPGGGRGGPGGGFGPGGMLARQILSQGDKNNDEKVSREELTALAEAWYEKLDPAKTGKVTEEQFVESLPEILPPPGGGPGFRPPGGGRGGFGPGRFMGPGLFAVFDTDKDSALTRDELKQTFAKWATDWDPEKSGLLSEAKLRTGLAAALPRPNFGDPGGPGGPGGGRGRGGPTFRSGPPIKGVELDPLYAANDQNKVLIAKLLAVPSLRSKYLGYVKDIAEKWLDWNRLGPIAEQYHSLIAEDVQKDTRKLNSTEDFLKSLTENVASRGGPGPGEVISLKNFAEQRRAYLLNHPEIKKVSL